MTFETYKLKYLALKTMIAVFALSVRDEINKFSHTHDRTAITRSFCFLMDARVRVCEGEFWRASLETYVMHSAAFSPQHFTK
jgi:hypothetical protein